jgi:hypothetical protein
VVSPFELQDQFCSLTANVLIPRVIQAKKVFQAAETNVYALEHQAEARVLGLLEGDRQSSQWREASSSRYDSMFIFIGVVVDCV